MREENAIPSIKLQQDALWAAATFVICTALAAVLGKFAGVADYFAPMVATAGVLANAGSQMRQVALNTVVVYLVCVIAGALGYLLLPASSSAMLAAASCAYLTCQLLQRQHPPALAVLVLVFLRQPDLQQSAMLILTACAMAAVAWSCQQIRMRLITKGFSFRQQT